MVVQFETYGVDGATANSASVDNWATLDRWGHIFVYEDKPFPSECGSYWINHDPVAFSIRVGRVETIGDGSTPRLIRKL